MLLDFTIDAEWQAHVDRVVHHYVEHAVEFLHKSYGKGGVEVGILFMCRDASIHFKRRARFSRAKAELYTDVMLHLPTIIPLSMKDKMRYVSQELVEQLAEQLNKRRFVDFDHKRFLADLAAWLERIEDQYDGKRSGAWHYASDEED